MGPYELVSHAAWTGTPAVFCCIVARIRLAGVSAAPVLVAGDFPAPIVRTPPPLKAAGPVEVAAPAASRAVPPAVFSASTPTPPAAVALPRARRTSLAAGDVPTCRLRAELGVQVQDGSAGRA